jgi:multiple sugar transport system permease protein
MPELATIPANGSTKCLPAGWFTAPAAVLLVVLVLAPLLLVVAIGFTNWQLGAHEARFVALSSYVELFNEPDFLRAAANTGRYIALVVPLTTLAGLIAALLIAGLRHGAEFYRLVFFMPSVATLAAMAVAWQTLLSPTVGALPQVMQLLGLKPGNWLQDPDLALPVLALIGVWAEFGFAMLFFLAGLKSLPRDLDEAAALDGLSSVWDRLTHVVLPHLAPILLFTVLFTTLHALRVFDTVAIITRGGPEKSTLMILYYIYQEGFSLFRTHLAACASVLFAVVVLGLSLIQFRLGKAGGAA